MGLGYCADAVNLGEVMVGRDTQRWRCCVKNGNKVWMKIQPSETMLQKEAPLLLMGEQEADAAEEEMPDANASEDADTEVPVAAAPIKKPRAPRKPKAVVDAEGMEEAPAIAAAAPIKKPRAPRKPKAVVDAEGTEEEPAIAAAAAIKKPRAPRKPKAVVPMPEDADAEVQEAPKKKRAPAKKAVLAEGEQAPVKVKRAPSAYNLFVRDAMLRIKLEQPTLNGKDVMRMAVDSYKVRDGAKPKAATEVTEEATPERIEADV